MKKQAKLIELAGVMGLDMANASHAITVAASVKGIENLNAFVDFCRDTKDGVMYAAKTERLDTLATRFKRMEEDARLAGHRATGERWVDEIVGKVQECRTVIKSYRSNKMDVGFRHIFVEGVRLFADKQLNALASVGSTNMIIELAERGTLGEELIKKYMDRLRRPKAYEQITNPASRVMSMVEASAMALEMK